MDDLVVALGNPGRKYQATRHNIGQMALEKVSFYNELVWKEKFKGIYAKIDRNGKRTYLLRPLTYMNLSGESVQPLVHFFKIEIENILVVYDEIDLPFGTMVFKQGGGLAGHNGLKSIARLLGESGFNRLRLGIGRPDHGSVADYVLSSFGEDESIVLPKFLELASNAIETYINDGFQEAAGRYSKQSIM